MASIKLGQLLSLGGSFINGLGNKSSAKSKAAAQDLLKKSKLELPSTKEPTSHMKANPLGFASIQFPRDLGNSEQGHYMIFYVVSSKHSEITDNKFHNTLGVSSVDTDDYGGSSYNIQKLRTSRNGDTMKIGKGTRNSVNSRKPVHNTVTTAVALYMPPAIKASYSVVNGPTELGMAGLAAKTFAETTSASGTQDQIEAFLKGAEKVYNCLQWTRHGLLPKHLLPAKNPAISILPGICRQKRQIFHYVICIIKIAEEQLNHQSKLWYSFFFICCHQIFQNVTLCIKPIHI